MLRAQARQWYSSPFAGITSVREPHTGLRSRFEETTFAQELRTELLSYVRVTHCLQALHEGWLLQFADDERKK